MTKEEYAKLLSSDYWKGYSYSLIKERNFTCEDCGKCFFNERNQLQVHHLVYRDVNPWSYKPEELVVLCQECHQRRHGIIISPSHVENTNSEYENNIDSHNEEQRPVWKKGLKWVLKVIIILTGLLFQLINRNNTHYKSYYPRRKVKSKNGCFTICLVIFFILLMMDLLIFQDKKSQHNSPIPQSSELENVTPYRKKSSKKVQEDSIPNDIADTIVTTNLEDLIPSDTLATIEEPITVGNLGYSFSSDSL